MGTLAKGIGLVSSRSWIRRQLGAPGLAKVLDRLAPDSRTQVTNALTTDWVPIETVDAFYRATIEEFAARGITGRELHHLWRDQGRYVATENLGRVLRAVLTFFGTAEALFDQLPRLWDIYFRGVSVTSVRDGRQGNILVCGLGGVSMLAPLTYGWTDVAFERVGADATVVERHYEAGQTVSSDPLEFEMSWVERY